MRCPPFRWPGWQPRLLWCLPVRAFIHLVQLEVCLFVMIDSSSVYFTSNSEWHTARRSAGLSVRWHPFPTQEGDPEQQGRPGRDGDGPVCGRSLHQAYSEEQVGASVGDRPDVTAKIMRLGKLPPEQSGPEPATTRCTMRPSGSCAANPDPVSEMKTRRSPDASALSVNRGTQRLPFRGCTSRRQS